MSNKEARRQALAGSSFGCTGLGGAGADPAFRGVADVAFCAGAAPKNLAIDAAPRFGPDVPASPTPSLCLMRPPATATATVCPCDRAK